MDDVNPETTQTRAGPVVHAQDVMNHLHQRYGRTIGMMMQENAELSAALAGVQAERDEALAKLKAING